MRRCYDCQNFRNLETKKTGGGVTFTREEFVLWKRASSERRRCNYCGLDSAQLYELNLVNPRTKKRYETIGVDRIDNSGPYELANLVPCCAPCNQVKSQLLTFEEMKRLGQHLRAVWDARIASRE